MYLQVLRTSCFLCRHFSGTLRHLIRASLVKRKYTNDINSMRMYKGATFDTVLHPAKILIFINTSCTYIFQEYWMMLHAETVQLSAAQKGRQHYVLFFNTFLLANLHRVRVLRGNLSTYIGLFYYKKCYSRIVLQY